MNASWLTVFQFLIGTLKTRPLSSYSQVSQVSIPDRYAKNNLWENVFAASKITFQFLIGTLKTSWMRGRWASRLVVSIPDRYAKNSRLLRLPDFRICVSIPDRYAKNKGYVLV
mgnify:CR=1 FL=1